MTLALRLALLTVVLAAAVAWTMQSLRDDPAPLRTLLVTGFGPFGAYGTNPSWEAARHLDGEQVGAFTIRAARLDVTYADAPRQLHEAVAATAPHGVLCLGVAPGDALRLEVLARNLDACAQPDVAGEVRDGLAIHEGGRETIPTALPVDDLERALEAAGHAVVRSEDAGGYLCNHVFYRLMDEITVAGPRGFIHVPAVETPEDLEAVKAAVRRIVEVLAKAEAR